MLKAWHVWCGSDPSDGSLLVFEATVGAAKALAWRKTPYDWDYFPDLHIRRAPDWDAYADTPRVVETNEEMPESAPAFYDDERC